MKFVVGDLPPTRASEPAALARMVEERPFESLFFTDHTHIPASRETPYPACTEAAVGVLAHPRSVRGADGRGAVTERIKLGTDFCSLSWSSATRS